MSFDAYHVDDATDAAIQEEIDAIFETCWSINHLTYIAAERVRMCDLVRRMIPLVETAEKYADAESVAIKGICSLKGVDSSMVDTIRADIAALIREARAAIGEETE